MASEAKQNPIAALLNERLAAAAPEAFGMLSGLGRRLYFPKGILSQSAEAKQKAHRFDATIGIATEGGSPMYRRQQPGGDRRVEATAHGDGDRLAGDRRAHAVASRRSSANCRSRAPRKAATSSSLFDGPKLTRSDDSASSRDRPIASRAALGSTAPAEQAEPVETAKPSRSNQDRPDPLAGRHTGAARAGVCRVRAAG